MPGTITLANGQTYSVASDAFKTLKLGDLVTVEFTTDTKGLMIATAVKVAT